MRGGFVHNHILLEALAAEFQAVSGRIKFEVATNVNGGIGYIDMVVRLGGRCLVVEAELSSRRVASDWAKAVAMDADELWIVVPTSRVAKAVSRQVLRIKHDHAKPDISILTLGQARQRIKNSFPLNSGANVARKENTNTRKKD